MNKEEFIERIESLETNYEKTKELSRIILESEFPDKDFINIDGSGDGGIDLYYVQDPTEDNEDYIWYLVQTKYGTAYRDVTTVLGELSKLKLKIKDQKFTGRDNIIRDLREFISTDNDNKKLVYLFLTTDEHPEIRENLDMLEDEWEKEFGIDFQINNLSLDVFNTTSEIKVSLTGNFIDEDGTGQVVGKLALPELYSIISQYEKLSGEWRKIFDKNVRYEVTNNKVMDGFEDTIVNHPEQLFAGHNGLCILVDRYQRTGKNFVLVNPSIANGGSSSARYYKYSKRTGNRCDLAKITCTIISTEGMPEEQVSKITEWRNSQKSVGPELVLGLDPRVLSIKDTLLRDYGSYVETKQNEVKYVNKSYSKDYVKFKNYVSAIQCSLVEDPGGAYEGISTVAKASKFQDILTRLSTNAKESYSVYLLTKAIMTYFDASKSIYRVPKFVWIQGYTLNRLIKYTLGDSAGIDKYIEFLKDDTKLLSLVKDTYRIVFKYADSKNPNCGVFQDYPGDLDLKRAARCVNSKTCSKLNDMITDTYLNNKMNP